MTPGRTRLRLVAVLVVMTVLDSSSAAGQALAVATPESVGMSSQRLARLTAVLDTAAREQQIAGTVTLVARSGRIVYAEAAGMRDIERDTHMSKDTIFRIASMSKAITTVGAMMLVEEGRILLTDPVGKYIPAFAKTTVLGISLNPVPARRAITIRDLMTHTSGISCGGGDLEEAYRAAGFTQWYFADRAQPIGDEIENLARLPLEAHPASRFVYGYSTDVLGHLIEKVSGLPLDRYLETRVFKPLGMIDTCFFLPVAKASRLATVYGKTAASEMTRAPRRPSRAGRVRERAPGCVFRRRGDSSRRRATTPDSCRCCSTEASWTVCGFSVQKRSS